jgi:hypothetical protein
LSEIGLLVQFEKFHSIYLPFDRSSDIVEQCVRSKLRIKNVWGGNTATLPGVF